MAISDTPTGVSDGVTPTLVISSTLPILRDNGLRLLRLLASLAAALPLYCGVQASADFAKHILINPCAVASGCDRPRSWKPPHVLKEARERAVGID